jgi:homopolymeric O-antigen transport system ATP-binding protein
MSLADRTDRRGGGRMRFTKASVLNGRLEPVDSVTTGQDVAIVLDYETTDGATLRNANLQIKVAGALGQPLFACLASASTREQLTLPSQGRVTCTIPHLPLMPGGYTFTVWCTVNDVLEDYLSDAGNISVVEGDYYGTGKLPPASVGDFLVNHRWSVE